MEQGLDAINMFGLLRWVADSRIVQKAMGWARSAQQAAGNVDVWGGLDTAGELQQICSMVRKMACEEPDHVSGC